MTFTAGETAKTVSRPGTRRRHRRGQGGDAAAALEPEGGISQERPPQSTGHHRQRRRALQQAWLSRFGRTVGGHVTDAVSGRLVDGLTPGAHATVAGQAVDLTGTEDGKALADLLAGLGQRFGAQAPANDDDPFSRNGLGGGADSPASSLSPSTRLRGLVARPVDDGPRAAARERVPLGRSDGDGAGPGLAAWGRAAHGRFDGEADSDTGRLGLDGEVLTGTLGADADFGRMLAGVAVSLSEGDGTFDDSGATTGAKGTCREHDDDGEPVCAARPHRAGLGLGPRGVGHGRDDPPLRRRHGPGPDGPVDAPGRARRAGRASQARPVGRHGPGTEGGRVLRDDGVGEGGGLGGDGGGCEPAASRARRRAVVRRGRRRDGPAVAGARRAP